MNEQIIINSDYEKKLESVLEEYRSNKIFIVHGKSYEKMSWKNWFESRYNITHFVDFQVNPTYESVILGRERFIASDCEVIIAIGGGSAIDVAKCIKLFSSIEESANYLGIKPDNCNIPFVAIPTTAGTGSESTRFAVIYYEGEKQSVMDDRIIPDVVVLDKRTIDKLPIFQKKVTMCDALAHSIESFWSVNSTDISKEYSRKAMRLIMENYEGFLSGNEKCSENMLIAANIAGKGINIAFTTAGHAMSYKLTSMFGFLHGQAAIICIPVIWRHMLERKDDKLNDIFLNIAKCLGKDSILDAIEKIEGIIKDLSLYPDITVMQEQLIELSNSVNVERLKNNPVMFEKEEILQMYKEILMN